MSKAETTAAAEIRSHWDKIFSERGHQYGDLPNAWLWAWRDCFKPGMKAAALADGYGRNGVFMAECGMDVDSMDLSPVGVEDAKALAASRGVSINAFVQDLSEWQPEPASYDVIALIYAHFSSTPERDYNLRRSIHQACVKALKPGGLLVLEAFGPDQLNYSSGGPKMPHLLYTAAEMAEDFDGLDIHYNRDQLIMLAEGDRHKGTGAVVRFAARKP